MLLWRVGGMSELDCLECDDNEKLLQKCHQHQLEIQIQFVESREY